MVWFFLSTRKKIGGDTWQVAHNHTLSFTKKSQLRFLEFFFFWEFCKKTIFPKHGFQIMPQLQSPSSSPPFSSFSLLCKKTQLLSLFLSPHHHQTLLQEMLCFHSLLHGCFFFFFFLLQRRPDPHKRRPQANDTLSAVVFMVGHGQSVGGACRWSPLLLLSR